MLALEGRCRHSRPVGLSSTLLIVVYAIAPPVAGLIGMMFFDQHIGPFVKFVSLFGWQMKVGINYFRYCLRHGGRRGVEPDPL